jgi:hypothetical protein
VRLASQYTAWMRLCKVVGCQAGSFEAKPSDGYVWLLGLMAGGLKYRLWRVKMVLAFSYKA